jgi:tRNA(His) 5'-end guanylyltransferase
MNLTRSKIITFTNPHRRTRFIPETEPLELCFKGSYLMVTPDGRFFENMFGRYRFSRPIDEVGFDAVLSDIRVDSQKFRSRGGGI